MRLNQDVDEQITRLGALQAGVPFAWHAYPRTIGQPRRNLNGQGFGPHLTLLPGAGPASRIGLPPGAAARHAGPREHHVPARRLDHARAETVDAVALRRRHGARPPTGHTALL